MKKLLIIGGLLGALFLGLLIGFRGQIREVLKEQRGNALYEDAKRSYMSGNLEEASRKAIAAHYQQPENNDIVGLLAVLRLQLKQVDAIEWWQLGLERGVDLPEKEMVLLTRILFANGQFEEALPFLQHLVNELGTEGEVRELWLESLRQRNQIRMARALTERFFTSEEGLDTWNLQLNYISYLERESGLFAVEAYLLDLLKYEEFRHQAAFQLIIRYKGVSRSSLNTALEYLHEVEDPYEKLMIEGVRLFLGDSDREQLLLVLEVYLEDTTGELLDALASWVTWMGSDWVVWMKENISEEEFRSNRGRSDLYWNLLASSDDWETLLAITQLEDEQLDEETALRFYYRGLAQIALGAREDGLENIELAATVVPLENSRSLERELLKGQYYKSLSIIYDRFYKEDPESVIALQKAIGINYFLGNQDQISFDLELADNLDLEFSNDQFQLFVNYLHLILGKDIESCHKAFESLLAKSPEFFDYRVLLAFSWRIQGREDLAKSLIVDLPDVPMDAPRHFRLIYAFLLQDSKYLREDEWHRLLPRERYFLSMVGLRQS